MGMHWLRQEMLVINCKSGIDYLPRYNTSNQTNLRADNIFARAQRSVSEALAGFNQLFANVNVAYNA